MPCFNLNLPVISNISTLTERSRTYVSIKIDKWQKENNTDRLPEEEELLEFMGWVATDKANQIRLKPQQAIKEGFDNSSELQKKLEKHFREKYPEIKLNITNNPIWEQGGDIFNQEEYNNQVNYRLKATEILLSDKAKQVFEKGQKNNWSLDKILTELQIPKEQKQLILNLGITDREQIALELANSYSYTVEINTTKETSGLIKDGSEFKVGENYYYSDPSRGVYKIMYSVENGGGSKNITKEEFEDARQNSKPTQFYSNLTVPGGTNYTENEISTPLITPSIKGHAQFATDKSIGWFRSDDKIKLEDNLLDNLPDNFQVEFSSGKFEYRKENNIWNLYKLEKNNFILFNKNEPIEEVKDAYTKNYNAKNIVTSKTRRILEVQSDLFQKGRNEESLVRDEIPDFSGIGIPFISTAQKTKDTKENQFLQLLNKDNNWVTFFVKSIVQQTAKERIYEASLPDIEEKVSSLQKEGKLKIDCK